MKNIRFVLIGLATAVGVAVILLVILFPLGKTVDAPPMRRITVLLAEDQSEYWDQVADAIQQELGTFASIQIIRTAPTDTDEQRKRFEMAIAADVDGMIVCLSDDVLTQEMLEKANMAGFPVVLVDSDVQSDAISYSVGSDHRLAGAMAAELLHHATGGQANIAILSGSQGQESQRSKVEGFCDAIAQWPKMQVVCTEYSNMDAIQAAQIAQTILKAYPEVNAIIGISDADLEGIIKTMDSKINKDAYRVIGFDNSELTLQAVKAGTVLAVIAQSPRDTGAEAAKLLRDILEGTETGLERHVPIELFTITSSDVEGSVS